VQTAAAPDRDDDHDHCVTVVATALARRQALGMTKSGPHSEVSGRKIWREMRGVGLFHI
jgi:hypothetical protein